MSEGANPSPPHLHAVDDDPDPHAPPPEDGLLDLLQVARALLRDLLETAGLELSAARLAAVRLLVLGAAAVALALTTLIAAAAALALLLVTLGLNPALAAALTALLLAGICALLGWRMARYARLLAFPASRAIVRRTLGEETHE